MQDKDIRNLIIIWVVGIGLAVLTGYLTRGLYDPAAPFAVPTEQTPTTSWLVEPATDIAELAQRNFAFTVKIIFPFLFAPILTLLYIIVRFSKDANPKAAHFDEHLSLEVFWTVIPVIVLVVMSVPAYEVLRKMDTRPESPDVVVDVTGAQFYWQYQFPKYNVTVTDDGTGSDPLVIPVGKEVLLNGTSHQVNHAWWVPAFGVKFDVIPGRINTGHFVAKREGYFKGQCAELCGALHAYMFIHVKVVPEKEFYEWLKKKGAEFPADEMDRINKILGADATPKSLALAQ